MLHHLIMIDDTRSSWLSGRTHFTFSLYRQWHDKKNSDWTNRAFVNQPLLIMVNILHSCSLKYSCDIWQHYVTLIMVWRFFISNSHSNSRERTDTFNLTEHVHPRYQSYRITCFRSYARWQEKSISDIYIPVICYLFVIIIESAIRQWMYRA